MKTKRDSDGLRRCAVTGIVCWAVFAGAMTAHTQPAVSVASSPGFPGSTVSLPVSLRRATNVTALQFDVAYSPAKVTAGALMPGTIFSNHVVRTREVAPGVYRTLAFSRVNTTVTVTNSDAVATLPFTVAPSEYVSSGPIAPRNVVLARPDATAIAAVTLNAGTIFVRPVNLLPSGEAQCFVSSEPDTRYLIQATTDFVHWVNLTNTTATGNFMDLLDADAARYPHRFYRWVLYDAAGEIGAVTQLPGGGLSMQFRGLAGRTYVLQASSDLQRWTDLSTNVATWGTIGFTNLIDGAFPHRFFRLKSE
jgi:hypothetical protein